MRLEPTLRLLAVRLGADPIRDRPRLVLIAAALSLVLWSGIGWGVGWLVERLVQS